MNFDDIRMANDAIRTTNIKGKEYAEVNQRIKAFRMCYPEGCIHTEMISNDNGVCVFKAMVYANGDPTVNSLLGTGHAYEKESSSYINKTSYIENCETSAVGRALGMCGFGIDTSVASYEEVANAIQNQEIEDLKKEEEKGRETYATPSEKEGLKAMCKKKGVTQRWMLQAIGMDPTNPGNMTQAQYGQAMNLMMDLPDAQGNQTN